MTFNSSVPLQNGFIDLPSLVGEHFCTFLDQGDLLSLRLVCSVTKSWVEAPRNLSSLCIDVKRSSHIDRLLRYKLSVVFTNFKIRVEKLVSQTHFSTQFATLFGPRMKILKITSASAYFRKIDLLLNCPCLEIVELTDLSFKNISPQDLSILGNNFSSYEVFLLDELNYATVSDVSLLISWITASPNLKHLRLPQIQFEPGHPPKSSPTSAPQNQQPLPHTDDWDDPDPVVVDGTKDFCHSHILNPILKSIKNGNLRLKKMDIERFCMELNNDPSLFAEMALVCSQKRVQLTNVPFGLLAEAPFSPAIIASCKGLQLGRVDVGTLTNMTELSCSIGFGISSTTTTLDYTKELAFPSLEVLQLRIFSMQDAIPCETVQSILTTKRPTLKKLNIAWNLYSSGVCPVSGLEIGRSFHNLRILELTDWGGNYTEFQSLFAGLVRLEELCIKDCKCLSDDAFCCNGLDNISPFRKLTKLRKLKIRCYDNGVSDRSLQEAFSIVGLRSLCINFVGLSVISLRGLSSLDRLPFKNSIQYLSIHVEDGISYGQIKKVVEQFGNLKKYKIE